MKPLPATLRGMRCIRCVYCERVLGDRTDADLVAAVQGHFDVVCQKPVAIESRER